VIAHQGWGIETSEQRRLAGGALRQPWHTKQASMARGTTPLGEPCPPPSRTSGPPKKAPAGMGTEGLSGPAVGPPHPGI
jgi:hypothetical protein